MGEARGSGQVTTSGNVLGDRSRAPDLIDEIIGWRGWTLGVYARSHVLASPFMDAYWLDGQLEWDGLCRCGRDCLERAANLDEMAQGAREVRELMQADVRALPGSEPAAASHPQGISEMRAGLHGEMTREQRIGNLRTAENNYGLLAQDLRDRCPCGINAFNSLATLRSAGYLAPMAHPPVHAVGTVALSGEVRGFERGWRAGHARIERVWAVDKASAPAVETAAQAAGATYMGVLNTGDLG